MAEGEADYVSSVGSRHASVTDPRHCTESKSLEGEDPCEHWRQANLKALPPKKAMRKKPRVPKSSAMTPRNANTFEDDVLSRARCDAIGIHLVEFGVIDADSKDNIDHPSACQLSLDNFLPTVRLPILQSQMGMVTFTS